MRVIFHVGMGKTGTTTIQRSLVSNIANLRQQGITYLGQWMGLLGPQFDGFVGLQRFLRQDQAELRACAHQFAAALHHQPSTCLASNEQFLENIANLREFFEIISREFELQFVIYVRHPAFWLPSAYAQWGIVHKTNQGNVEPFGKKARTLIKFYDFIRQWREAFGQSVVVREFREGSDVLQDFASFLGVSLPPDNSHRQERLSAAELMLRASFNSRLVEPSLPDRFDTMFPPPIADYPKAISAKNEYLFDQRELQTIIAENTELFGYIEREFGLHTWSDASTSAGKIDNAELMDTMLGYLVDAVTAQAQQIRDLNVRLLQLESK